MKKIIFLLFFFLTTQVTAQFTHGGRGMYVDRFFKTSTNSSGDIIVDQVFSILSVTAKEDSLLKFARDNHITYLILYDLQRVLGVRAYEDYLCSFLEKAKTLYCIEKFGVPSSCASMFGSVASVTPTSSIISPSELLKIKNKPNLDEHFSFLKNEYQPGDSLFFRSEVAKLFLRMSSFNERCDYKFDVMVTEYEFWIDSTADDCSLDIASEELKYTRFQQMICDMDSIRDIYNAFYPHKVFVEVYLGYLRNDAANTHIEKANWIDSTYDGKRRVDRINLHYYSADGPNLYSRIAPPANPEYYGTRFLDFCQPSNPVQSIINPIFSSEDTSWGGSYNFLGSWFRQNQKNNIFNAEKGFYDSLYTDANNFHPSTVGSATLGNVVQPGCALWFASSQMVEHLNNRLLYTSNSPVCVTSGNGTFQFQYQGPIEKGLEYKFYITHEGESTPVCGTSNAFLWPVYNAATHASLNLNSALTGCSFPVGIYDVHLELTFSNSCSTYIAPVTKVMVVNSASIVALTPVTVCAGNAVYLKASTGDSGTNSYLWYKEGASIGTATSSSYAPNTTEIGSFKYKCKITSTLSGCSVNSSNEILVSVNANPKVSISKQALSNCNVLLKALPLGGTYIWNDGSTDSQYTTSYNGVYSVEVTKNGCKSSASLLNEGVTLNSNVFLEGHYSHSTGLMDNGGTGGCLFNLNIPNALINHSDTVFISAMDSITLAEIDREPGILESNGNVSVTFCSAVLKGKSYYIKINHRNSVEIWSAKPVLFNSITNYYFSNDVTHVFDSNMKKVHTSPDLWAIYCGDIDQDGAVDAIDFNLLNPSIQNGDGGYLIGDLNGDGAVDAIDFVFLDPNIQNGRGISVPDP